MSTNNTDVEKLARCPAGIQDHADFQIVTPRERLEYLLEFADSLPELPPELIADRDSMEQVHECQSPVFLHTDVDDDQVTFHFDVPEESPTVGGYAAILQEGFDGATVDAVMQAPDDIYMLLGLQDAMSATPAARSPHADGLYEASG